MLIKKNSNSNLIKIFRTWERHFLSTKRLQNHPIRIKLCIVLVNKIRRLLPVCVGRQNLAVLVFFAGSTSNICRSRRLRKDSVNAFLFWVSIGKIWQSRPAKKNRDCQKFSDCHTRVIIRRFYYTRKINSYINNWDLELVSGWPLFFGLVHLFLCTKLKKKLAIN